MCTAKLNVIGDVMVAIIQLIYFETDTNSSFRLLHQGAISSGTMVNCIYGIPR